ncbi:MAG TPA: glycosyltransferase [Eudoraea sp.]|nr:glycosyltransferase [Eudoraea sp.]
MDLFFSFVIPVYNRPDEIRELLQSLTELKYDKPFEIVIVEDGSEQGADMIVHEFIPLLPINYLTKANTGPGDSRNYGMQRAGGNYFIIMDSDCLVPSHYLQAVETSLQSRYVDFYGGPDAAHPSFSNTQKAINYALTSVLTTGGIRGSKRTVDRFQPRSFNMGISRKAWESSGGFGRIHPGEDPDLSLRLWKKGFSSKLIPEAFVYHQRRIDFRAFFLQVKKFGMVRPILNQWHPGSWRIAYWFPLLFCLGFFTAISLLFLNVLWPLSLVVLYVFLIFVDSLQKNKNLPVALLSIAATAIQFLGYGLGFLKSTILVTFSKRKPQEVFPDLFF